MLDVTVASLVERHKIASTAPQYVLLEVVVNDSTTIRVNRSPEDVTWKGNLYLAYNFDMDMCEEKGQGQLSTVQLRISNVNRMLQQYLEQYGGGVGCVVNLYSINAVSLPDGPADVALSFEVTTAESAEEWVTFTLGADSPLRKSFPKYLYLRDNCIWKYKSAQCAYAGGIATCKKTFADCQAHSNVLRFGGFPAIDSAGFRTANIL